MSFHDDGQLTIECSGCGERLVRILVTNRYARGPEGGPICSRAKAKCHACGEWSYPVSWEGAYAVGGEGEGDGDDLRPTSRVRLAGEEGGVLLFHTSGT